MMYMDITATRKDYISELIIGVQRRDAQIDKLIKIFKQKNVKVRIYHYENGNYIWEKLSDGERKNWLAVFQKYKKMLKEYE